MTKSNKEIGQDLINGIADVSYSLDEFHRDPKVIQIINKTITPITFIESITDEDPYGLVEVFPNNYRIQSKDSDITAPHMVSQAERNSLLINKDIILEVYPELTEIFDIKITQGCTGCKKGTHALLVINCMFIIGGIDRDFDKLKDVFNYMFIDKMKETEPQKNITAEKLIKQYIDSNKNKHNYLTRQCPNCTKEHLASAIVWLLQYRKDPVLYKTDLWMCIGELKHAEYECIHIDNELSKNIRIEKRRLVADHNYNPQIEYMLGL